MIPLNILGTLNPCIVGAGTAGSVERVASSGGCLEAEGECAGSVSAGSSVGVDLFCGTIVAIVAVCEKGEVNQKLKDQSRDFTPVYSLPKVCYSRLALERSFELSKARPRNLKWLSVGNVLFPSLSIRNQ